MACIETGLPLKEECFFPLKSSHSTLISISFSNAVSAISAAILFITLTSISIKLEIFSGLYFEFKYSLDNNSKEGITSKLLYLYFPKNVAFEF